MLGRYIQNSTRRLLAFAFESCVVTPRKSNSPPILELAKASYQKLKVVRLYRRWRYSSVSQLCTVKALTGL